MRSYQLFLNLEIVEVLKGASTSRRSQILNFLRHLRENPFTEGDFRKSKEDRSLEVKVFGKYSVYFWADHAVGEVKVVEILKSDE